MMFREVELKYTARRVEGKGQVRCALDVAHYCRAAGLGDDPIEKFVVLYLNTRHHIQAIQTVAHGTAGSVNVHPRDVFRGALMAGATSVIVAHNHPSGDVTPSLEDRELTRRLVESGNLLGVRVLDHVIVGELNHHSLAEFYPELFA